MNTIEKNLCKVLIQKAKKGIPLLIFLLSLLLVWVCALYVMVVLYPYDDTSSIGETILFLMEMLYLLLFPIPGLVCLITACVKKYGKKEQCKILIPKTENKDLMGFDKTKTDNFGNIPWIIFCSLSGVCLFFLDRKYFIAALLLLRLPFIFLERKWLATDGFLEKKKQLREDVLHLWENEKNQAEKSLHYAVIMEDDSGLIPSCFGNGNYHTANVLLFDQATEIAPFLGQDQEKNYAENWGSLYLFSDFFIYAFDSTKYTIEVLEEKLIHAVTSERFPVSKPLYLLIKGSSPMLEEMIRKYIWLPEVFIRTYDLWDSIQIEDIINDYMDSRAIPWYKSVETDIEYAEGLGFPAENLSRAVLQEYQLTVKSSFVSSMLYGSDALKYDYWNYISASCYLLKYPLEDIACKDINYFYHCLNSQTKQIFSYIQGGELSFYHHAANFYVCGFFPNIFRWKEISIGVMAEFEYAHLALRFVHYYLFCKHKPGPIEEYFREDKKLGEAVYALAHPEDMLYSSLHREISLSDSLVHNALFILKESFGIEHRGDSLDFLHLTNILRISRNITRGHGAIRHGMQDKIWFALYVLLNLLNEMLSIGSMEIKLEDGYVNVSYTEDTCWYRNGQYAVIQDNMPLLLHGISKRNCFEYINYYKGSAAVPEVTERKWSDAE